jgi:hypothetical protein
VTETTRSPDAALLLDFENLVREMGDMSAGLYPDAVQRCKKMRGEILSRMLASRSSAPSGCNCEYHPRGHPHEARMFAAPSDEPPAPRQTTVPELWIYDRVNEWFKEQPQRQIAELVRDCMDDERAASEGTRAYPHMCRDGHEEVGWRGEDEMCPVCSVAAPSEGPTPALPVPAQEAEAALADIAAACDTGMRLNLPASQIVGRIRDVLRASRSPEETPDAEVER